MTTQPQEINNPNPIELNQLAKALQNSCRSGIAFAVLKKGEVLIKNYFGYADMTHKVAVGAQTKFPLASISKIYTSVILHKLAAEGRVDLNKMLNHYVPDTEGAGNVTIRNVLLMTAGLCDAFEMFLISGIGNLVSHDIEDHYLGENIFMTESVHFKDKFIYSNSGYIFLAKLIENVTGLTYEQALKEYIFTPLQLNHTDYFDGQWRVVDSLAIPNIYQQNKDDADGNENYIGRFYRNMAGAGHLAANLDDMIAFAEMLRSLKLGDVDLSPMLKKRPLAGDTPSFYGAGLQIIPLNQRRHIFGHSGSYYGIKTALFIEPESETAVVILSNDNDIEAVKWAARLLAAASGADLMFPLMADDAETETQDEQWLCAQSGLHITLARGKHPQKISLYGETKDLIFIGEGRYMVPYALFSIILTIKDAQSMSLNVGGIMHDLVSIGAVTPPPQNVMEYVGRYKNPHSDLEMNVKMVPKQGLSLQFGGSFNAVRDAHLTALAKDYFTCTVQESNGTPTTLYLKFEREQFSQMISGITIHQMRIPQLSYRRLKTI